MKIDNDNTVIEIAKAGLNRFFSEGYTKWPEDKLLALFDNRPMSDPIVKKTIEAWENEGAVVLHRKHNNYLEILRQIK